MDISPRRALDGLGWAYASIPIAGAALWALTGTLGAPRNRSPIDLTQLVELGILFAALKLGLTGRFIIRGLSNSERAALGVLILIWGVGIWVSAPEPFAALERTVMRLPHLGAAVGLCFLLSQIQGQGHGGFDKYIYLQPLLHLPLLICIYVVYVDDPRMNWLGGPLGFWHVRIWGMVLAAAIAVVIGLHASRWAKSRRSDILLFCLVTVLTAMLAWSGSRGPILGVLVAYALAVVVLRGPMLRGLIPVVAALVLGTLLSLQFDTPDDMYGLDNSVRESNAADLDKRSGGRVLLWTGTIAHIAEKPLLGHGFDQFRYVYQGKPEGSIQPHNSILQIYFDFGLIAGTAAIFLLLRFWWRVMRPIVMAGDRTHLPAAMALNTLAIVSLFDGALYHSEPLALIALSFGIGLSARTGAR